MMEGLLEGGDEKRVDACGRKGGVAGKLVADVSAATTACIKLLISRRFSQQVNIAPEIHGKAKCK